MAIDDVIQDVKEEKAILWKKELEDGIRTYIDYLEENKEHAVSIVRFFECYDPATKRIIQSSDNKGKKYSGSLNKLLCRLDYDKRFGPDVDLEDRIRCAISDELRIQLDELIKKYLKEYTIEDGMRMYLDYMEALESRTYSLQTFFYSYNPSTEELVITPKGQKKPHVGLLHRLLDRIKNDKTFSDDIGLEGRIRQRISPELSERWDKLNERLMPDYGSIDNKGNISDPVFKGEIVEGVNGYINYVRENGTKSTTLQTYFISYNCEKDKVVKPSENEGKTYRGDLHYCYKRFQRIKSKSKAHNFEDWVRLQIPEVLLKELDSVLAGTKIRKPLRNVKNYSKEDGVRMYIEHLKENEEKSKPMPIFFQSAAKYDESKATGGLLKYYCQFIRLNLPEDVEFQDWIAPKISPEMREELGELTSKYFKKYSLEQGIQMFLDFAESCEGEIPGFSTFFSGYDPVTNTIIDVPPEGKTKYTGKLNVYYSRFIKQKSIDSEQEFIEWVRPQISGGLRKRLDIFAENHLKEYSLEEGVEMYIKHLEQDERSRCPIVSFFCNFVPQSGRMSDKSDTKYDRRLRKYYSRFTKMRDWFGEGAKFIDAVRDAIGPDLKQRLDNEVEKHFAKQPTLEEGVEMYITQLRIDEENMAIPNKFFQHYSIDEKRVLRKRDNNRITYYGKLNIFYERFKNDKPNLPNGTTFEDYLLSRLPEEKRPDAAYYLKGQYLEDLRKARVDPERLKGALLGEL